MPSVRHPTNVPNAEDTCTGQGHGNITTQETNKTYDYAYGGPTQSSSSRGNVDNSNLGAIGYKPGGDLVYTLPKSNKNDIKNTYDYASGSCGTTLDSNVCSVSPPSGHNKASSERPLPTLPGRKHKWFQKGDNSNVGGIDNSMGDNSPPRHTYLEVIDPNYMSMAANNYQTLEHRNNDEYEKLYTPLGK